jgi:hypothetical protein
LGTTLNNVPKLPVSNQQRIVTIPNRYHYNKQSIKISGNEEQTKEMTEAQLTS